MAKLFLLFALELKCARTRENINNREGQKAVDKDTSTYIAKGVDRSVYK